ncbi:MAG: hypothetical protein ACE5K9_11405 [Candidatus Methylomirabilales bacterium]
MKPIRILRLLLLLCILTPPSLVYADAIIVTKAMTASTIAEVFVEESAVRVELEIGIQDLRGFRNLMPDEIYERLGYPPKPLGERLRRFFRHDLVIRAEGRRLAGRVREMAPRPRVRRDEITGERLPAKEGESEIVVFAVLEYTFSGRPASLTMVPPREDGKFVSANIGFVVYHLGLPVNDFRYFSAEEVLALDWDDPWYSRFRNKNLRRQYDAPMSAFLYVEPYEVRSEIIARPKDLQHWIDLGLEGRRTIPVAMQPELKRKVAEFLAKHINVTIDGQPAKPTLDRIHFLRRTLRTSGVIDPPEELDAISATLGVIFVFPTKGLPQEATMTWDLFSPRIQKVRGAAIDEAGPLPYFLQPDDAVLRWQNFLKNPTLPTLVQIEPPPVSSQIPLALLGLVCGVSLAVLAVRHGKPVIRGQAPPKPVIALAVLLLIGVGVSISYAWRSSVSDGKAKTIVTGLLKNVYRAFDYRDESVIYDTLDRSASGELLAQIYLETRRGLELQNQGGARVKVKNVEMLKVSTRNLNDGVGFVSRCTWNVSGSVGHWGHIHQRTNQYEAELTIKPVDGVWKITGLELLQEERI